jgi:class 3 adenylate cyclase
VLFVDLVGFTPLAERRDPEEIRELLSLYFDRAQAIVGHYGGTVEKFIGDAVMAVWGAPVANEDDAERAVRAALEIVASVAALGTESGIDLAARAGVVTGEVAITIGKVSEGMVLGDTVNSASRVQSVAPPGAVLVDESTWRAASGAVAFSEVGDLQLKGKQDLIHAWRAVRVVAQRKGVGRSERLEPPFVGRDEELRLIKDLFHSTAREQRARLVSVTGIPGIGKSRLLARGSLSCLRRGDHVLGSRGNGEDAGRHHRVRGRRVLALKAVGHRRRVRDRSRRTQVGRATPGSSAWPR